MSLRFPSTPEKSASVLFPVISATPGISQVGSVLWLSGLQSNLENIYSSTRMAFGDGSADGTFCLIHFMQNRCKHVVWIAQWFPLTLTWPEITQDKNEFVSQNCSKMLKFCS